MEFYQKLYILLLLRPFCVDMTTYALPSVAGIVHQQVKLVKDLMVTLHKIHRFDNIIIYRNINPMLKPLDHRHYLDDEIVYKGVSKMLTEHILSPQLYRPFLIFNSVTWQNVNNTMATTSNLGDILSNKNLAVVIFDDIFNMKSNEFVALSLGASLETKIVFVLIGQEPTNMPDYILQRFFDWCWSKNMLNVILVFQEKHTNNKKLEELKLKVYSYTPFPMPLKIINLTEKHASEYFQDRTLNLMGYIFRAPVAAEKPLVFKTLDPVTGVEKITGICGKIYMEYIKHLNASFQELEGVYVNGSFTKNMHRISDLLNARKIDISMYPITALRPNKFSTSYTISNSNNCIIVPVKREIFLGLYITRALNSKMWFLLAVLFLIFQLVFMFIDYDIYGAFRPWVAFSVTLKGLLYMPVDNICRYKTITINSISFKRKMFMYMLLLLTGMIYSQTQIAALSSFLSSTLYPEQIDSLEDLVKANLSIMLVDYVFNVYNYLDIIPDSFGQNLIITDAETVSHHLSRLDTRYAYTVYIEEWKAIQHMQMGLSKPLFKIVPHLCISNVHLNLPLQFNSPFHHSLKQFIMYAQAAGLYDKWSDIIYWDIFKANGDTQVATMENVGNLSPLKLEHLTYVLYAYYGGMIAGSIAFLIELLFPRLSKVCKLFK